MCIFDYYIPAITQYKPLLLRYIITVNVKNNLCATIK